MAGQQFPQAAAALRALQLSVDSTPQQSAGLAAQLTAAHCLVGSGLPGADQRAAAALQACSRQLALDRWRSELAGEGEISSSSGSVEAGSIQHPDLRSQVKRRSALSSSCREVLQAWLQENLEYPYPSEMEKEALARKAGVRKEQVTNWFINARGRAIWKGMLSKAGLLAFRDEQGKWRASPP